ncbi:MAG: hypothetical protein PHN41_02805 [Bacteroidales bacterium]|jgi:hypothetical protein|nr:hypothetical protein [Bacteroidales bacterium]MDD4703192.1 hypothetical protein [Bacteroidales bacterium]MDX9798020.1 hypothetical protein [Bacteroidales bacterium]
MRKTFIKLIGIITILTFLIACSKEDENDRVVKVVQDFYTHLNNKDFDSLKVISTKNGKKYVEIIQSIGNDVVKINSIDIIETSIVGDSANVYVKTTDSFNNISYIDWILIKDSNVWKFDYLEGLKGEDILTDDDFNYSKIDHVRNAMLRDSLINDSISKLNLEMN